MNEFRNRTRGIHFKCTAQASCSGCTATRPITKLVSASIGPARASCGRNDVRRYVGVACPGQGPAEDFAFALIKTTLKFNNG